MENPNMKWMMGVPPVQETSIWMNATRDKQCHKPDMNGNSLYIPPIKMVITGGWFIETVLTTLFHLDLSHDPKIRTIPRHICPTLPEKWWWTPLFGVFSEKPPWEQNFLVKCPLTSQEPGETGAEPMMNCLIVDVSNSVRIIWRESENITCVSGWLKWFLILYGSWLVCFDGTVPDGIPSSDAGCWIRVPIGRHGRIDRSVVKHVSMG